MFEFLSGFIHHCVGEHNVACNLHSALLLGNEECVAWLQHKVVVAAGILKRLFKVDSDIVVS